MCKHRRQRSVVPVWSLQVVGGAHGGHSDWKHGVSSETEEQWLVIWRGGGGFHPRPA